jgi:rod shape-determining protein MreB
MFEKHIGVDLGTVNVLVYVKGKGIVLSEPSMVAIAVNDNKIVAVGAEARAMMGRTPENIEVMRPMRDGVIANYVVTEAMLRYFIGKVCGRFRLFRPVVMVTVPVGVTSVERKPISSLSPWQRPSGLGCPLAPPQATWWSISVAGQANRLLSL